MSAPLVVNLKDGTVWTRRGALRDGAALYAPAGVCDCPEFVMATEAELAQHGIAGVAYALPMPVGPVPSPRSEEERLLAENADLQVALEKARLEVAAAGRERDAMRERVSEPYGCAHCGTAKRYHGRRYVTGVGGHGWEQPSDEQVMARMLARRAARLSADALLAYLPPMSEVDTPEGLSAERLAEIRSLLRYETSISFHSARAKESMLLLLAEVDRLRVERDAFCDRVDTLTSVATGNKRHVVAVTEECQRLAAEVMALREERHSTNEALDDAVQELRGRQPGAEAVVPQTERSYWVAIADSLNAAQDAGMPVGIDLDGTLTDHRAWSVVWDRDAGRWTVAGYEDETDGITQRIAPTQALQPDADAETGGAS